MPAISNVGPSGNQDIDGLLSSVKWTSPNLTYSFPSSASFYEYDGEPDSLFVALTPAGQAAVDIIVTWFSSVSNLTFTKITETATTHATIRFARAGAPDGPSVNSAHAYYPDPAPEGGDAWFNRATATMTTPTLGSYGWSAYAHELGHAVGLKHGHETDTYGALPTDHDSSEYSIMTYRSYVGSPGTGYSIGNGSGPQSLMQDDIAALQYMYGANYATNNTNTTYTWSSGTGQMSINGVGQGTSTSNKVFITIWDGGGTDTYDLSNYGSNLTVDLDPGAWTITATAQLATLNGSSNPARGNIANALLFEGNTASLIENATGGSGNDTIRGNVGNNHLMGGSGTDLLDGRSGNDILDGGSGFDSVDYALATSGVTVDLSNAGSQAIGGGMGSDTLSGIERIIGSSFDDSFTSDTQSNTFEGGSGNDRVLYTAAASAVTVNLGTAGAQSVGGGQGSDTLNSIERLTGSDFNDILTGNGSDNILNGGDGNDTLAGIGSSADTLNGDGGSDTAAYASASSAITVDLALTSQAIGGGQGTDTLNSIENVIGSDFGDMLSGNGSANTLTGGAGNDTLRGLGGNDTLDGGADFDTVDYSGVAGGASVDLANGGAQAIGGSEGSDTLISVEALIGSASADTFFGNASANTLSGGNGDDILRGGGGDDTLDGQGNTDTVSFADAASAVNVNLGLAGPQAVGGGLGSDSLISIENAIGSDFGDTLSGTGDANDLRGGQGNDTLAGVGGADNLFGEDGNDAIFGGLGIDNMFGGDGDDLLYIADNDGTIEGGIGYDQAIVLTTNAVTITVGSGIEYVAGNNGADTLSAAGTTTAITIGGAGGNDTLTGGEGNDTLAGMDDADTIFGMGGNDQLFAGAGSDNFFGGDGDDLIYILGNDATIEGGIGFDQAIILDTNGVSITLGSGIEYGAGNNGNDSIDGSGLSVALTLGGAGGDDTVTGGSAGDTLSGSFGIDTIFGNDGGDIIFGGDDNDLLYGGEGNDQLFAGAGSDVMFIEDSSGIDSVSGFADGLDLFDFSLHTTVTDFSLLTISVLGGDALVDFDGGQLFIAGAAGLIDSGDFLFA